MKIPYLVGIGIVIIGLVAVIGLSQSAVDDSQNKIRVAFFPSIVHAVPIVGIENQIFHQNLSDETKIEIKTRRELPQSLSREWSYDRLNITKKGIQVKNWARKVGKTCPGSLCNHIEFEKLSNKKIAFGHIVSQDWTRAFTFLLDKKDHPDNLYLTCNICNSSLSNNFPDSELRKEIMKTSLLTFLLKISFVILAIPKTVLIPISILTNFKLSISYFKGKNLVIKTAIVLYAPG